MEDIYLKIKSIRLKNNLTQEDVAKRLGMAQSNFARMERGLSQITVDRLSELADVFEMSPQAILSYSEDQSENLKEDVQYLLRLIKKQEGQIVKLKAEIDQREEDDTDYYTSRELEKKKLSQKVAELKKELADKNLIISRLENDIEERKSDIQFLKESNNDLRSMLPKNNTPKEN